MSSITSVWRQYFENHHEGLGTTYERFILHQYFENIKKDYSIQNVVEVPSFGMTGISGINSMWWAYHGAKVIVVDQDRKRIDFIKKIWQNVPLRAEFIYQSDYYRPLPFKDDSSDMSWNFASLCFVPKLEFFLKELTRITTKVVFICFPNKFNLFRMFQMMFPNNPDISLYPGNNNLLKIKNIMLKLKWKIADQGYLDVPLWPDIAMKKEELLQKIGLTWLANRLQNQEQYMCILDYFSGKNRSMNKEILRYSFLEHSPLIFKRFWAHHQYLIFIPMEE